MRADSGDGGAQENLKGVFGVRDFCCVCEVFVEQWRVERDFVVTHGYVEERMKHK